MTVCVTDISLDQ